MAHEVAELATKRRSDSLRGNRPPLQNHHHEWHKPQHLEPSRHCVILIPLVLGRFKSFPTLRSVYCFWTLRTPTVFHLLLCIDNSGLLPTQATSLPSVTEGLRTTFLLHYLIHSMWLARTLCTGSRSGLFVQYPIDLDLTFHLVHGPFQECTQRRLRISLGG